MNLRPPLPREASPCARFRRMLAGIMEWLMAAMLALVFVQFGNTGECKSWVAYGEKQDYVVRLGDFCVFFDSPETIIEPLPLRVAVGNRPTRSQCLSVRDVTPALFAVQRC